MNSSEMEPQDVLRALGLSESETAVYLAILGGAQTARDVCKVTKTKRPTVYYAISCLEKRGLLARTDAEGDKFLMPSSLERLSILAEEKAAEAEKLRADISALLPALRGLMRPGGKGPKVTYFEGVEAVQGAVMESLRCKGKEIWSVAPNDNFFWGVGEPFVRRYVTERRRRGIRTRNLWEQGIDPKVVKEYYAGLSDVRILPAVMRDAFHSAIFLYDDKTLAVSSFQNAFCTLIESQEHADTMRAWFEGLWSCSKPHAK